MHLGAIRGRGSVREVAGRVRAADVHLCADTLPHPLFRRIGEASNPGPDQGVDVGVQAGFELHAMRPRFITVDYGAEAALHWQTYAMHCKEELVAAYRSCATAVHFMNEVAKGTYKAHREKQAQRAPTPRLTREVGGRKQTLGPIGQLEPKWPRARNT